jgi:hypothetical protein
MTVFVLFAVVLAAPAQAQTDAPTPLSATSSSATSSSATSSATASVSLLRAPLFRPLRANVFEPRVGGMLQTPASALSAPSAANAGRKLRLDIGMGTDLVSLPLAGAAELRFGSEFFTLTRLRSEVNFRFPVETTDFYFGVNASFQAPLSHDGWWLLGRLRVAHISSHLVDGVDTFRQTFVYSREFVDAVLAAEWRQRGRTSRVYAGANTLFHTIPENFGAVMPQIGFDVQDYTVLAAFAALFEQPSVNQDSQSAQSIASAWLERSIGISAGYDLKLTTINGVTSAIHTAQAGLRFGAPSAPGVFAGVYWYEGKSLHGMFYNERDSYVALGFQIDF